MKNDVLISAKFWLFDQKHPASGCQYCPDHRYSRLLQLFLCQKRICIFFDISSPAGEFIDFQSASGERYGEFQIQRHNAPADRGDFWK